MDRFRFKFRVQNLVGHLFMLTPHNMGVSLGVGMKVECSNDTKHLWGASQMRRLKSEKGTLELIILLGIGSIIISIFFCTRDWIKETKDAKYKEAAEIRRAIDKQHAKPERGPSGYQMSY